MLSYQVQEFGRPLVSSLRETPSPEGTEVILKVGSCGVCHSDVHLHDGYFDLGDGNKLDMTRALQPPRTLGHEIAGTVAALGPLAQGLAIGARRVVYPWIGCQQCPVCAAGDGHLCGSPRALGVQRDGGFADHVVVPDPRYLLEYEPLSEAQACTYACSGLTAFGALKKLAPPTQDAPLLIIGAGGVGLSGIRLASQLFETAPIVAEIDPNKWDLAREAGAREIVDPSAPGALKTLFKLSGGVAAAIDFVGAKESFSFGLAALRKGGTLICVGLFGGSAPVVPAMISMKAVTIRGSYVGSLSEMHELMAIARAGKLPDLPMKTQPLETATQALSDLKAGLIRGRTILQP